MVILCCIKTICISVFRSRVMQFNLKSVSLLLMTLLFALGARPASSENDELSLQMRTARVAVDVAPLYAQPEPDSQRVGEIRWTKLLLVDLIRLSSAPHGWIPLKGGNKRARGRIGMPDAWIRREDVVIGAEYRKVIGCWPVKSLVYVAGDYAIEIEFKLDGSAKMKEWGDDARINKVPVHNAEVYIARNVVEIEATDGAAYVVAGYHAAERKLYPEGLAADQQELFPESALKECSSIPLLEK